jgi:Protein of unknown function (DUF1631)
MDNSSLSHPRINKDLIVKSSLELILKWSKIHFSGYIEQLDQHLFNLADKFDSNANQTRYFQTRDEINRQSDHCQSLFLNYIDTTFDRYLKGEATIESSCALPTDQSANTLSLVDNGDLEETLAINTMSRKISSQNAEVLHHLNQRFSALRGGKNLTSNHNPVAPGVYAEAIRSTAVNLTLDSIAKLVTYKVFETAFMTQLDKLYDLLSKEFEHQGLLPNLTKPSNNDEQQALPEELQRQFSEASITHQIQLIEAIRQLQLQRPPPVNLSGFTLPAVQIIANIAQLQHDAAALLQSLESPQSVAASNFLNLREQSEQEALKSQEGDARVVEIVGLLFEYMLNDEHLPDSVKALLSYLHTPFLKIALLDRDFFNLPEHPARQLLNSLVAAGERWVEPKGKHKNDVFLQIKSVVQRLLDEFDDNVRLFSELVFEFNHYLRQHARRIRLSEKRAMQAAKGENKLKEIRLKVHSYLKKKVGNIQLPTTIYTLLFEPWANYLSFNLLRFGSHSEQWRMAAQTVNDILWVSQPHNKNNLNIQRKLMQLANTLPETLLTGFETVGYDSSQGDHLLKALQKQQTLNSAAGSAFTQTQQPTEANIDEVDITHHSESAADRDDLIKQLKSLEFGTWFVFNVNTPGVERVKLAWSDQNTLHFMFVNRMGQQIAVKTGEQLAKEIRTGKVKILDKLEERPFFEKAMERVLEQIKQRETSNNPALN